MHNHMPQTFNYDGCYDGTYQPLLDTLVIKGDSLTVRLCADDLFTPEDLASMAADTAAHLEMATDEVNNSLAVGDLPAAVDTSRPGIVIDGQTVLVYLIAHGNAEVAPPTGRAALAPDAIQFPDTEGELRAAANGLSTLFPGALANEGALELARKAARLIGTTGCRSAAELTARGVDLRGQLALALTDDQMRDALLFITFGRAPAGETDRQQLIAKLVAESGGARGVDADAVPGGTGPFGRTPSNPVPVAGIVSERQYLDRLRTADQQPVNWRRKGSQSGKDGPVDCYELTSLMGEPLGKLFISPYHQRTSSLVPDGLHLDEQ